MVNPEKIDSSVGDVGGKNWRLDREMENTMAETGKADGKLLGIAIPREVTAGERMRSALERITGNVVRLAETETRMEAFRLRNIILTELDTIRPILYRCDPRVIGAVLEWSGLEKSGIVSPTNGGNA
jgi:hypothetical protein